MVTGASGFVGDHLTRYLRQQGITVIATGKRSLPGVTNYQQADLTDSKLVEALLQGIDTLFHCAGYAHADQTDQQLCWRINVEVTNSLLTAAVATGVKRVVYISSVKADNPDQDDIYGQSKRQAELNVLNLTPLSSLTTVVIRPALVYGSGVKGNLLKLMQAIHCKRWLPIPNKGLTHSMIDIRDLCGAVYLAAQSEQATGNIYTITDGQGYRLYDVIHMLQRAMHQSNLRITLPLFFFKLAAWSGDVLKHLGMTVPFDTQRFAKLFQPKYYSNEKARQELGFAPEYQLEQAIPEIVASFLAARQLR